MLRNLDASALKGIKAMVASCKGLLWITRGGAIDSEQPDLGLAVGFMRTLRNEYVGRKLLTLDLDPKTATWAEETVPFILQILQTAFASADSTFAYDAPKEFEYAERDGMYLSGSLFRTVILPSKPPVKSHHGKFNILQSAPQFGNLISLFRTLFNQDDSVLIRHQLVNSSKEH